MPDPRRESAPGETDVELLAAAQVSLNRHAEVLRGLGQLFAEHGHELYLVGGSVRDALLGRLGADLDFTTDARPERVMELARAYARRGGGVIAVMHDLNLTAIYADHVALIHNGQTVAQGTVADVLTDDRLSTAFGCPVHVNTAPESGATFLLPHASAL